MEHEAVEEFYKLINVYKPRTYCEIGTHNGLTAAGVIKEMFKYVDQVTFDGYDAFQSVPAREHNGKSQAGDVHYKKCVRRMEGIQHTHNLTWTLHKGFTTDTLITPRKFDLAYIDGGHSYETVLHDYNMLKDSHIIIFDDYNLNEVKRAVDSIGLGYQLPYTARKKKKWVIINK